MQTRDVDVRIGDSKRGGINLSQFHLRGFFRRGKIVAVELTETKKTGFPYLSVWSEDFTSEGLL